MKGHAQLGPALVILLAQVIHAGRSGWEGGDRICCMLAPLTMSPSQAWTTHLTPFSALTTCSIHSLPFPTPALDLPGAVGIPVAAKSEKRSSNKASSNKACCGTFTTAHTGRTRVLLALLGDRIGALDSLSLSPSPVFLWNPVEDFWQSSSSLCHSQI